ARSDITKASQQTDAPAFVASIASSLLAEEDSPETAVQFLADLIKNTEDDNARQTLTEKLKEAAISRDIFTLRKGVEFFEARFNRELQSIEELKSSRVAKNIPLDPYGGTYYW